MVAPEAWANETGVEVIAARASVDVLAKLATAHAEASARVGARALVEAMARMEAMIARLARARKAKARVAAAKAMGTARATAGLLTGARRPAARSLGNPSRSRTQYTRRPGRRHRIRSPRRSCMCQRSLQAAAVATVVLAVRAGTAVDRSPSTCRSPQLQSLRQQQWPTRRRSCTL